MKSWQAGLCGVGVMAAFVGGCIGFAWLMATFFSPETTLLLIAVVAPGLIGWKLGVAVLSGDRR